MTGLRIADAAKQRYERAVSGKYWEIIGKLTLQQFQLFDELASGAG
jgi:hypothetical protein